MPARDYEIDSFFISRYPWNKCGLRIEYSYYTICFTEYLSPNLILSDISSANDAVGEGMRALIVWGINNYIRWRPMDLEKYFLFLFLSFGLFYFADSVEIWLSGMKGYIWYEVRSTYYMGWMLLDKSTTSRIVLI